MSSLLCIKYTEQMPRQNTMPGDYREIFIKKYDIVQKLDHLKYSKSEITTSLSKPIKLVKLQLVF